MVFSRVSSSLLGRNPFTSKSVSSFSSSPLNNFNLTSTISKFHPQIFSNPRTADFFQVRQYSDEIPSSIAQEKKKSSALKIKLAKYNRKVDEAYQAIERVKEVKSNWLSWPSYKQDAERSNDVINIAVKKYAWLMSKLGDDERKDFDKANMRRIRELVHIQGQMMNDDLMNFKEFLNTWNTFGFGEAWQGSGGISSQSAGLDNADSGSPNASEVDQSHQPSSPILTPTSDFFAQALVDKKKEAVVIQFMKERYMPAVEMMKALNDVSGMGVKGHIDDLIGLLIKTAVKKPEVFNFECRETNPG